MKVRFSFFIFLIVFLSACSGSHQNRSGHPDVLFTIDGDPVSAKEFEYGYRKNNIGNEKSVTREDIDHYLDLYINFKLKVKEARARGYDTTRAFQKEYETYKYELIRPYLSEYRAIDSLCVMAYDRMKWEVKAAHILIRLPENPLPSDTLKAYEKISGIRQRALNGEDFETLAKKYSDDPSAKTNGGMLGYFTVFQMVYPFESAAYNTEPGQISPIIRTRFGYHILKVYDKRPSRGKVKVAHILIRVKPDSSNEEEARNKIFEIHDELTAGVDWNALCTQFSEDGRTRYSGGSLPYLTTGQIDNAFADAAFSLDKPGDISDPFRTRYGWHIVKLEDKKEIEPYEKIRDEIESKVRRDTRGSAARKTIVEKMKKESGLAVDNTALQYAFSRADPSLLKGKWSFNSQQQSLQDTLISFEGGAASIKDFFIWVQANQRQVGEKDPVNYMKALFNQFLEKTLMQNEISKLVNSNESFRLLLNEYFEGMLLFDIMDREVWTKSTTDTAGLRAFYNTHKDLFMRGESVDAEIYNAASASLRNEIRTRQLDKDYYTVGETEIKDFSILPDGFVGLMKKMQKLENGYLVISGSESTYGGIMDSISNYLTKTGIPPDKITIDYTEAHPNSILISVNSQSKKSLELLYNTKSALTLQVDAGKFEKGDHPLIDTLAWKPGLYETERDGRYYLVRINRLVPPEVMSFNEARGKVITKYQDELEKNWLKALKNKYIVEINDEVLRKVYKDLENPVASGR